MMVVASAALVQFIVLAILVVDDIWMEVIMSMAVRHSVMIVIIVMVVGFPSMTALFKFVDDLERVLMLVILFVEVMVMGLMKLQCQFHENSIVTDDETRPMR